MWVALGILSAMNRRKILLFLRFLLQAPKMPFLAALGKVFIDYFT